MNEIWKHVEIPDYLNGRIMISNYGNVYSLLSNKNLSLGTSKTGGYKVISTKIGGRKGKYICYRVHRLVAFAFVDGYEEGLIVNHKDGNKLNNYYENLEWVTYKENTNHALKNNLLINPLGDKNGSSKLTEEEVVFLKENKNVIINKFKRKLFCELFNIDRHTLSNILTNKYWKHIVAVPLADLTDENYLKFKKLLEQKYNKDKVKEILQQIKV